MSKEGDMSTETDNYDAITKYHEDTVLLIRDIKTATDVLATLLNKLDMPLGVQAAKRVNSNIVAWIEKYGHIKSPLNL